MIPSSAALSQPCNLQGLAGARTTRHMSRTTDDRAEAPAIDRQAFGVPMDRRVDQRSRDRSRSDIAGRTPSIRAALCSPLRDRSAPVAGRRVHLAIWGWAQAGLLAALAGGLVVLTAVPTPPNVGTPAWSTSTGHTNGVRAVAFSRDGRRLATGGIDGAVVIWRMGLGAQRVLSSDSRRPVICLAFAPDGETLAAGDHDSTLTVWSTRSER
jgi:WD40 repeat protein